MSNAPTPGPESTSRKQPLERIDRRVLGVLVEKAKTTPENYPLSLNALLSGCNQKSNRFPQMQLDETQVEAALERLRDLKAVSLIQGDGRVDKHRHLLYDWLGVDKVELAVMAELLLRAQTLGELRGRAARMEPIKDIGELRPIVDRLQQKGLVILLTPSGRGCVVTHALYQEPELAKLRGEYGNATVDKLAPAAPTPGVQPEPGPNESLALQELRAELSTLQVQLAEMCDKFTAEIGQLQSDLEKLQRQPDA